MIVFHLPFTESTNKIYSGVHYTIRSKHKKKFRAVPIVAKPVTEYPVKCHYHFMIPNNFDTSNHSYLQKLIEDSLVKANILKNDSKKYVNSIEITAEKSDNMTCEVYIIPTTESYSTSKNLKLHYLQ